MKKHAIALAVSGALLTAGCAQDQQLSKRDIATGIGMVAGAILGNKIGDGGAGAILAGAAAGMIVGNMIGSYLDEQDRQALLETTKENVADMKPGEAVDWKSDRTGSQAKVKVLGEEEVKKEVGLKVAKYVAAPEDLRLESKLYQAKKSAVIYDAPSEDALAVAVLSKGKTAKVVGATKDGKWLAVSRKGAIIGYVPASSMVAYAPPAKKTKVAKAKTVSKTEPTRTAQHVEKKGVPEKSVKQVAQKAQPKVAQEEVADLDALPAASLKATKTASAGNAGVIDLDNVEVKQQKVAVISKCKVLEFDIKAKGKSEVQKARACQDANGTWEL